LKSLCIAAALALIACVCAQAAPAVIISSKLSSESAMIGEMIRLRLDAAGVPTVDRMRLGATPVVRRALLDGEIDLYVEYTGNGANFFHLPSDPAWKSQRAGYQLGSRLDYAQNRIVWLTPAPATDAWALAVRGDLADAHHLRTMSDFARWVSAGGRVVLACSAEFANAGTLRSLERTYGFKLSSDQLIVLAGGETEAMIAAAAARTDGTNTAMVYSTDGGISAADLVVLEDDRHEEPIYAPVPLIRAAALRAYPRIAELVRPLMQSLDQKTLQRLNEQVQVDGEAVAAVAREYLASKGLSR